MNILVITSCTDKKLSYSAPAAQMYIGGQHTHLMDGLEQVWSKFGKETIDLAIISAKYGLIRESDVISYYNYTFSRGKKERISEQKARILEGSKNLKIHEKTEALIARYDLVFFLLGEAYVWSLRLPFAVPNTVTQIFLAGNNARNCIPDDSHFIPAGPDLAKLYGVMNIDLKGFLFKKVCGVVCERGLEVFESIKRNPQQFGILIRED